MIVLTDEKKMPFIPCFSSYYIPFTFRKSTLNLISNKQFYFRQFQIVYISFNGCKMFDMRKNDERVEQAFEIWLIKNSDSNSGKSYKVTAK